MRRNRGSRLAHRRGLRYHRPAVVLLNQRGSPRAPQQHHVSDLLFADAPELGSQGAEENAMSRKPVHPEPPPVPVATREPVTESPPTSTATRAPREPVRSVREPVPLSSPSTVRKTAAKLGALRRATRRGDWFDDLCPAHPDERPSLSYSAHPSGGVIFHCRAGCSQDQVKRAMARAVGCAPSAFDPPQIVATYDYCDDAGVLVYQVVRLDPKTFRQRRPDGHGGWVWNLNGVGPLLYRLPELQGQATVYIPEGEKDADRLAALGLPATCNSGGAGKWRDVHTQLLKTAGCREAVILRDNDAAGAKHQQDVARSCAAHGITAKLIELPGLAEKGDISDWLDAGHTPDELQALVAAAPTFEHDETEDDLPLICVADRRLTAKTRDALRALARANARTPRVFQQGGIIVRLRHDENGAPRVDPLTTDSMRGELDRVAFWVNGRSTPIDPPTSVVRDVLSQPSYALPPLRAIAETPFFTDGGQLVAEPGYHADAGIFLHGAPGLVVPTVPSEPSAEDVRRAKALLLDELLADFPFVDPASRAHAVGLLLLPFVRELIHGATPNHAIDAPTAGTGKGLLVDAIALLTTGRTIEVATESTSDEEIRKRLTALFLSGAPFALVDNATHRIDSPVLAAALTATRWTDRILGASRMALVASAPTRMARRVSMGYLLFVSSVLISVSTSASPWAPGAAAHHFPA